MAQQQIPVEVFNALAVALRPDPDAHARVLHFLASSEEMGVAGPYIRSLSSVVAIPEVFRRVAERIADDTRRADRDPHYQQFMQDVWTNFLRDNLAEHRDGNFILALPRDAFSTATIYNFMRSVARLPGESYLALQRVVQTVGGTGTMAIYGARALATARAARPLVRVSLVVVFLAADILMNIRRWWKGEITGIRCVKNIIDNGAGVAAGIVGGIGGEMIGAAIGSIGGPIGMAVGAVGGAIIGGAAAATAANALSDNLTQWVFGLPKTEALESAYNFLGVKHTACNSDINSIYRRLALQYHPDKGGDPDKWTQLQYSLAVIREARGEH